MEIADKNVLVTGGGNGIGRALVRRFAAEGARAVTIADVDGDAARATALLLEEDDYTGAVTVVQADLSTEAGNISAVAAAQEEGTIDLLFCNAGIAVGGGVEASDEDWYRIWDVNVMAHVWAIRAALPDMRARGRGYICTTASAAGLLTNIGAAPYSVTKHAALALAEWLAVTHGDEGIVVSCLCPQGVRTRMLFPDDGDGGDIGAEAVRSQGVLEPEDVAEAVVAGIGAERFLILPHPEVLGYFQHKAADYDRWLAGMRKLQARTQG